MNDLIVFEIDFKILLIIIFNQLFSNEGLIAINIITIE